MTFRPWGWPWSEEAVTVPDDELEIEVTDDGREGETNIDFEDTAHGDDSDEVDEERDDEDDV